MKKRTLIMGAPLLFAAVLAFGQTAPTSPVPPSATSEEALKTQLQDADIKLAIKDFQLIQASAQAVQQQLAQAKSRVLEIIAQVKRERGYGDDWNYNFQSMSFERTRKPPAVLQPKVGQKKK